LRFTSRAKIALGSALHRAGFDLVRSLSPTDLLRRRLRLLNHYGVNVVFDVGANAGQYASTMRALGYDGRIVSFEPSAEAFHVLADAARRDPGWTAVNSALGEEEGVRVLHVAANSQSSSLLPMLPTHVEAAPDSYYVRDETVIVSTLAVEIERHVEAADRLFVKIDTQGFERQVLMGAGDRLAAVAGLQVELTLVPLYEGQLVIEELIAFIRRLGYVPMFLEPDFFDPTSGQLLQADGIFFRADSLEA
jgi:FkbM family methyltransferase